MLLSSVRKQERFGRQDVGEPATLLHPSGVTDQAHRLFRDLVSDPARRRVAQREDVGENDVDLVCIDGPQQVDQRARSEHELDVGALEEGLEELDLEVPGERGEGAHAQGPPRPDVRIAERAEQLVAEPEDRVGVVERDVPRFGQDERPPAPLEQLVSELLLQLLDLDGHGGLGHEESLGGARQVALVGDRPEVAQVVEVEVGHAHIVSPHRTITQEL